MMPSHRLAAWRTIERYAANLLLPLSTVRLCQETGVSARALDYACLAYNEQSPQRRRMALAHEMLCRAGPGATVTNIATFCGFIGRGRFSVVDHRRYGQPPSQTLRQSLAR
jgi:transcriptional regulator GlxA family with amidase domain